MNNSDKYIARNTNTNRLYRIWYFMNRRCYEPRMTDYEKYGGRGIQVCDQWRAHLNNQRNPQGYDNFRIWALNNGYTDELTIDRVNPQGDYSPENCVWATYTEQNSHLSMMSNNKSGYRGVDFRKSNNNWRATIYRDGKKIHIGSFITKKDAVDARNNYIINNKLEAEVQKWIGDKGYVAQNADKEE